MSVSCYISGWNVDIPKTICYTLTDSMGNPTVIICKSCRGDSAAFAVLIKTTGASSVDTGCSHDIHILGNEESGMSSNNLVIG